MKYFYTGLGILLACLVLCVIGTTALDRYAAETASLLEHAYQLGETGAFEQAERWVRAASEGWEKRRGFFGVFLSHDQLDTVEGAFHKARAYAADANDEEFGPICVELIEALHNLSDMERPKYYNVL